EVELRENTERRLAAQAEALRAEAAATLQEREGALSAQTAARQDAEQREAQSREVHERAIGELEAQLREDTERRLAAHALALRAEAAATLQERERELTEQLHAEMAARRDAEQRLDEQAE